MWRRLVVLAAALAVSVPGSIAVAAASASASAPTCNRAVPIYHRPPPQVRASTGVGAAAENPFTVTSGTESCRNRQADRDE